MPGHLLVDRFEFKAVLVQSRGGPTKMKRKNGLNRASRVWHSAFSSLQDENKGHVTWPHYGLKRTRCTSMALIGLVACGPGLDGGGFGLHTSCLIASMLRPYWCSVSAVMVLTAHSCVGCEGASVQKPQQPDSYP